MSKCEDKITQILLYSGLFHTREKRFPDLQSGKLRFDFYIPSLHILIEYDSEIHFFQVTRFQKTKSDFTKAQERDRVKNSYALSHGIPLYRIPYWELQNIHSIYDIFNQKFLVQSRFHNDIIYREYIKSIKKTK